MLCFFNSVFSNRDEVVGFQEPHKRKFSPPQKDDGGAEEFEEGETSQSSCDVTDNCDVLLVLVSVLQHPRYQQVAPPRLNA